MRKIIVTEFMSLDGVYEDPGGQGTGKRLFADIHKTDLKLVETTLFKTGIVVFHYKV